MLDIYEGSLDKVKKEMKDKLADYRRTVKQADADKRKLRIRIDKERISSKPDKRRLQALKYELETAVKNLQALENNNPSSLLAVTRTRPIEVGGYLYNYLVLDKLHKRLKDFTITVEIGHAGLFTVHYKNRTTKGSFSLEPLPMWYKYHLNHIPKAKCIHYTLQGAM